MAPAISDPAEIVSAFVGLCKVIAALEAQVAQAKAEREWYDYGSARWFPHCVTCQLACQDANADAQQKHAAANEHMEDSALAANMLAAEAPRVVIDHSVAADAIVAEPRVATQAVARDRSEERADTLQPTATSESDKRPHTLQPISPDDGWQQKDPWSQNSGGASKLDKGDIFMENPWRAYVPTTSTARQPKRRQGMRNQYWRCPGWNASDHPPVQPPCWQSSGWEVSERLPSQPPSWKNALVKQEEKATQYDKLSSMTNTLARVWSSSVAVAWRKFSSLPPATPKNDDEIGDEACSLRQVAAEQRLSIEVRSRRESNAKTLAEALFGVMSKMRARKFRSCMKHLECSASLGLPASDVQAASSDAGSASASPNDALLDVAPAAALEEVASPRLSDGVLAPQPQGAKPAHTGPLRGRSSDETAVSQEEAKTVSRASLSPEAKRLRNAGKRNRQRARKSVLVAAPGVATDLMARKAVVEETLAAEKAVAEALARNIESNTSDIDVISAEIDALEKALATAPAETPRRS